MKADPNSKFPIRTFYSCKIVLILIFTMLADFSNAQPISRYLFGQNMWLTDGAEGREGYIKDLWPKIKDSGVKVIRIGGNGYNKRMPDLQTLTNWIDGIKGIGAEPLLQVSSFDSPESSADLVRHFNLIEANPVKYWSIGNEPYIIDKMPLDSISLYIKAHASAMKAVDPNIKIIVPDLAAYHQEAYTTLLLDEKLGVAGRDSRGNWYIDGVNFHNYPNAKDYDRSDVIFFSVSKMKGMIMNLKRDMMLANEKYNRYGDDELIWGITEFNITYHNPDNLGVEAFAVPSFINGQFWADVFGMAMEYGAFTVTPWCIQESDRARTYFGYIGGPPEFQSHSTYYHMQLMSTYFSGDYIKLNSNQPYLKFYGSIAADGITTLLVMNQSENESFEVDLSTINSMAEEKKLSVQSKHDFDLKDKVVLEPNSTVVLRYNESGSPILKVLYNLDMANENMPPKTFFNNR